MRAKATQPKNVTLVADGSFVAFDDVTWPTPMDFNENGALEWLLRNGSTDEVLDMRYRAASVVAAYRQMISDSAQTRNKTVKVLRWACKASAEKAEADTRKKWSRGLVVPPFA